MSAFHFMGFVMHQPAGNLVELLNNDAKSQNDAKQILLAYQRPLEYAERYLDVARFCVCFSGMLLEQLQERELVERAAAFIDIPRMLDRAAMRTALCNHSARCSAGA